MKINILKFYSIAVFALSILLLILFNEVIVGNKTFGSSDNLSPKAIGIALNEMSGDDKSFPQWQPWVFSGMPTAEAFTNISNLYFPEYLFKIFSIPGMIIQIIHLLFCGIGMILLLRYLKCSYWASLLGSIGFMITPYMVTMIVFGHGSQVMTSAYLPWIFMFAMKVWERQDFIDIGILSLLLGFQLQRAHVQIAYYTWLLIGAYFLFRLIEALFIKKNFNNLVYKKFGFLFVACVLGIAISMLIYLPSIEYSDYSVRGGSVGGGAEYGYATSWSFHPKEILTFFIPSAFGFGGQTYWGYMPFTDFPNYIGIVILLLAIIGFFSQKKFIHWFLIITTIIALFISFGKHFSLLYDFLYYFFPYFNKFRVPSMILILIQFNVCLLAAFGFDHIFQYAEKNLPKWFWVFSGILGALLFLMIFIGTSLKDFVSKFFPPPMIQDPRSAQYIQNLRWELWENDLWIMIVFSGLLFILIWFLNTKKITKTIFAVAAIALSVIDLYFVDNKIISPSVNSGRSNQLISNKAVDNFFKEDEVINYLINDKQKFRIYPLGPLFGETRFAAFGLESVGGYHPAKLKIYNDLIKSTNNLASIPALKMMNVKYLISPQPINHPELELVKTATLKQSRSSIKVNIYQLKNNLPRAWFVKNVYNIEDQDIWKKITDPNFNPKDVAFVENKIDNELSYEAIIKETKFSNHEISIKTKSKGNNFLVLSEVFYPLRWKSYINGSNVKTYKVNNAIRGLIVEDGENEIIFKLDQSRFHLGLIISIISFMISLIIIIYGYYLKRRV